MAKPPKPKTPEARLERAQHQIADLQRQLARVKAAKKPRPYQLYENQRLTVYGLPDFLSVDHRDMGSVPFFRGKRVQIWSPHADDWIIRSGTTAHLLNRPMPNGEPMNDVIIYVTGTGHRGVPDVIKERVKGEEKVVANLADRIQKIDWRIDEGRRGAAILGFDTTAANGPDQYGGRNFGQFRFINAYRTYDSHHIDQMDQRRVDDQIACDNPDVVWVPSAFDRTQAINRNTRQMVMSALRKHLANLHKRGAPKEVIVMEYPTNQMANLPDENLRVIFHDPKLVDETKKAALRVQKSQVYRDGETDQMLHEAHDTARAKDEMRMALSDVAKLKAARMLDFGKTAQILGGGTARGEHFKVLRARVVMRSGVPIVKVEPIKDIGEYFTRMAKGQKPVERDRAEGKYFRGERVNAKRERRWASQRKRLEDRQREFALRKARKDRAKRD